MARKLKSGKNVASMSDVTKGSDGVSDMNDVQSDTESSDPKTITAENVSPKYEVYYSVNEICNLY